MARQRPGAPGLGLDLNLDLIREHPPRQMHFNLWADDWQFRQAGAAGVG